jgi:hypothetical protein
MGRVGGLGTTVFHVRQKVTLSNGQEMLIRRHKTRSTSVNDRAVKTSAVRAVLTRTERRQVLGWLSQRRNGALWQRIC